MTERSERVERLLEDQDLKDAFAAVHKMYHDAIDNVAPDSDEDNTALVMDIVKMLRLLSDVKQALYTAIQDGHLEDFRAQEMERLNGGRKH